MIRQLSPKEVKNILERGENIRIIDVREEWEYETAKIENSELMPLSAFNEHITKLNPEDNLVISCHHGNRSYRVCAYLVQNGFKRVSNLDGGINAWSQEVDPSIPVY
ncbi:MAG TPA: rhodanese-like domain-containing protein [Ignavibacteriaceae bacterium]|nr:rhodanese-like domain-containing protein [Ignavibacteriaceae bacterium]